MSVTSVRADRSESDVLNNLVVHGGSAAFRGEEGTATPCLRGAALTSMRGRPTCAEAPQSDSAATSPSPPTPSVRSGPSTATSGAPWIMRRG